MANDPDLLPAALELKKAIYLALEEKQGLHAATAIAAAARLAGAEVMHNAHLDLKNVAPGTIVLAEQTSEEAPKLIGALEGLLAANGMRIDRKAVVFPPDARHAPLLDLAKTLQKLQPEVRRIVAQHGLSEIFAVRALAVCTAMIIRDLRARIDPSVALGIAAEGIFEGSKTAV